MRQNKSSLLSRASPGFFGAVLLVRFYPRHIRLAPSRLLAMTGLWVCLRYGRLPVE
jgi:hypothetical protein